uniref:Transmembrane protein n=1 Tax=Angiostrongylus cantonensis TaxID=6313 RepID=A0A0K0DAE3_ANGCA
MTYLPIRRPKRFLINVSHGMCASAHCPCQHDLFFWDLNSLPPYELLAAFHLLPRQLKSLECCASLAVDNFLASPFMSVLLFIIQQLFLVVVAFCCFSGIANIIPPFYGNM